MAAIPFPVRETQEDRRKVALFESSRDLLALADEAGVEDVVVNPGGHLWVNRTGQGFKHLKTVDERSVLAVLLQVAYENGFEFGHKYPILETDIPWHGARITGLHRPLVRGVGLAIRPHPKKRYTLDDYCSAGIITERHDPLNAKSKRESFLEQVRGKSHGEVLTLAVQYRQNILLGGSTGSGKTTALNMLFSEIGKHCPNDRVVGIEDTLELQWGDIQNYVSLLAANGISAARCLDTALRLKPHRIVVGEVRKKKAAQALLNAWNTGHSGGVATIHADDASSTLQRFEEILGDSSLRPAIARAVNVVAFIDECDQIRAGRKLREILVIHGYDENKGGYQIDSV